MAKGKNIVKSTQGMLRLLLVVIMVIAWVVAITTLLGNNEEEMQMELIQSADILLEDELYVRAAEKYVKAINSYTTDKNEELEVKLLSIYKEGNLTEEYRELIENRIESKKASPEEYISYASELLNRGTMTKAVKILAAGEEQYDDAELTRLYESVKYTTTIKDLDSATVKTPSTSWIMPTFDGEKWGYISSDGDLMIDFRYEEALSFAGSYTVVKENGVYIVIDQKGNKIAIDKKGLDEVTSMVGSKIAGVKDGRYYLFNQYFEQVMVEDYENGFEGICLNDNGLVVAKSGGKWAVFSADMEPVTEFIYDDVVLNSRGQVFTDKSAVVKDAGGYFIINHEGKAYFETRFAELKGLEGGLIAFSEENGKWGFINGSGNIIVEPQYEDAYSFSQHLGAVKYAGKWGFINRYNTMAIEAEYESVIPFLKGKSLVTDSFGNYKVITLKYQEVF